MKRVLISTWPFAVVNKAPLEILNGSGIEYLVNPFRRKLTEDELTELVWQFDGLIAGTEPITRRVLENAKRLKVVSRVGVGLDSVDLVKAKEHGIQVTYTPNAPAPAVAELTIGLILALLRSTHVANYKLHSGEWDRLFGHLVSDVTVGIIGAGRIGGRVLGLLQAFRPKKLLVNDLNPDAIGLTEYGLKSTSFKYLIENSHIISIHIPLTEKSRNLIGTKELSSMAPGSLIVNTSRGGIINEADLAQMLLDGHISGAAVDVFEKEPYRGDLCNIESCLLTAHMGSMSASCRAQMEIEATSDIVAFLTNQEVRFPVPSSEYFIQAKSKEN